MQNQYLVRRDTARMRPVVWTNCRASHKDLKNWSGRKEVGSDSWLIYSYGWPSRGGILCPLVSHYARRNG